MAEPVYPIDPGLSRALSAFDMRHNFVVSYRYKLPIEPTFRSHPRLAEGWAISGITRFTPGFPVTLFNNDAALLGTIPNGINSNGMDTPNYAPGPLAVNSAPSKGYPAFKTALFTLSQLGHLGTAARRFFYGPGMENFYAALFKNLRLTETKSLELRLEAFNAFNHAQFYGPAAVNGNISSARFEQGVSAAPPRLVQLAAKFCF